MKRLAILSTFLLLIIGSAKADNDVAITVSELPRKAQEMVRAFFSKNDISYVKKERDLWDKSYEVIFTNGEKVDFTGNGEWKEISCTYSSVPPQLIPAKIKAQIARQYPSVKIIRIERDRNDYEVKLSNKLEVKFNKNFQIVDIDN